MPNKKDNTKIYALLAAHSYPKRRMEETNETSRRYQIYYKNTRKVNLKSNLLKDYKKIPELTTSKYVTYVNNVDKSVVMSIRGTDLVQIEENDIYTDVLIYFNKHKSRNVYKTSYANLKKIYKKYPNHKVILVGHSLGGRICIDLLDSNLGEKLYEVHVFNSATLRVNLYKSAICNNGNIKNMTKKNISKKNIEFCNKRNKLHINIVNNDIISILGLGEAAKTKKVHPKKKYSNENFIGKKKKIGKSHSIMNFVY